MNQHIQLLRDSVFELVRTSFEEGPMSLQEVLDVIGGIFGSSPQCMTITVIMIANLIAEGVIEDETQHIVYDPIENHRWRLVKRN